MNGAVDSSERLEVAVRELAKEVAPCYPDIDKCEIWECLWAIKSSYEGLELANQDLHRGISKLQKRLNMDVHEVVELMTEEEKD
jgi:hypothetical protein